MKTLKLKYPPAGGGFDVQQSEHPNLIHDYVHKVMLAEATVLETRVRLFVRPAPRWCPERLWFWLASKVLYVTRERIK